MERETILLVEDHQDQREPNAIALEHAGYRVVQAETWKDALALTGDGSEVVGLILTDLVMHDGAGLGTFSKLRRRHGTIPVIVLSGYPSAMRLLDGVLEGVVDWLLKPVDVETVVQAVDRALGQKHE